MPGLINFFDRFGKMINNDPAQALFFAVIVLAAGFFIGRLWYSPVVKAAKERAATATAQVDWLKGQLVSQAPDREVELKRLDVQLAEQERLREKQQLWTKGRGAKSRGGQ